MLETDKKIILDHFNDRLDRFKPDDPQAVSWNSKGSQLTRFRTIHDIGISDASVMGSVLDVGCGVGSFYDFLYNCTSQHYRQHHKVLYTGIDINPKMIELAKQAHPRARFEVRDILDGEWEERFDYVVGSGIFSLEMPDWEQVTWDMIRAMFKLCRVGVAINFLSFWTPGDRQPDMHYEYPYTALVAASNITKKVTLRHDYRPNDFTLYLYR